ncbi:MAG: amidohydrolase family protein [Chloroflexota bacterium]
MISRRIVWLLCIPLISILSACSNNANYSTIVFSNVNLIPMNTEIVIRNQSVLIEGSRIVTIDDTDALQIPANAQIIDGRGTYLMPGLADMHMHTRVDWDDGEIWPINPLYLYLANGVTTIRDFAPQGSPLTYALNWREEISAGTRIGPTIIASGKLLFASPLDDPEGIVGQNFELGFDFLKIYSYLTIEDFHDVMTEAKELGMYTAGHIPYSVGLEGVLTEGMDEIAHIEELLPEFIDFDRNRRWAPEEWMPYIIETAMNQIDLSSSTHQVDFELDNIENLKTIAEQLNTSNIPVCTTMVIDDVIQLKIFQPEVFLERPENVYFNSGYLETFQRGDEKHQVQCRGMEALCAWKYDIDRWILNGLHTSGVLLLLGTDSGTGGMGIIPGYSIHDELGILIENGFSPYEALKTGTVNAARVIEEMNGDGNFGTIEVGNRADLVLVTDNPLKDISTLRAPLGVMTAGRWFSEEMLATLIDISKPIP